MLLCYKLIPLLVTIIFAQSCNAIRCFDCNSANNTACLDVNLKKMTAIIPIIDCAKYMPITISKQFFCRKITQTVLHSEKTPEVRITSGCGWKKHKRECYTNDNKDHLETVCQCFGGMCNMAASSFGFQQTIVIIGFGGIAFFASSRGYV